MKDYGDDKTFRKVMLRSGRVQKQRDRRATQYNLLLALAFTALALIVTAILFTGCSETTVQPCCNDGCIDVHTCAGGCLDECNDGSGGGDGELQTFVYICKDGKQKKIYEFNLDKWIKKGWKKGKCKNTPSGDDDDDDEPVDPCDDSPCPEYCDWGKTTICHVPPGNPENAHTITIGNSAVEAHFRNHDDYCGPCK